MRAQPAWVLANPCTWSSKVTPVGVQQPAVTPNCCARVGAALTTAVVVVALVATVIVELVTVRVAVFAGAFAASAVVLPAVRIAKATTSAEATISRIDTGGLRAT